MNSEQPQVFKEKRDSGKIPEVMEQFTYLLSALSATVTKLSDQLLPVLNFTKVANPQLPELYQANCSLVSELNTLMCTIRDELTRLTELSKGLEL